MVTKPNYISALIPIRSNRTMPGTGLRFIVCNDLFTKFVSR
ncbi:hypothetical protein P792_08795 [Asaia sp. SF2.1]|nr:hypothetical protein P792_08795 [Asaia sp. SF2.1]